MYWKDFITKTGKDVLVRFPQKVVQSVRFVRDFQSFKREADARFLLQFKDAYPCLSDRFRFTPFDSHYTYHPAWAARKLAEISPAEHIDISSILSFSTIASAFVPVKFYDYRPANVKLKNFFSDFADLKKLSFLDESISSLSCMHTIEHIGLGRYGDELDPQGDLKSIFELKRVLKQGGHLLIVTPVGTPRIEFNAHRIYGYEQICNYFEPLTLREFALVTDGGEFFENADPSLVGKQAYGCGCFWFTKP